MRLIDLVLLYLIAGGACAIALYRRDPGRDRVLNALAAIPLWPLWAPIAWTARHKAGSATARPSDRLTAMRGALEEAVASVAGTALAELLNREAARAILGEAERVTARNAELVRLLAREEFQLAKAERELEALEHQPTSGRFRASARLHLENVRRLHQLAERDERALEELAALVSALRSELLLVRLSGSSAAGVDDIVSDLLAHIEGLRLASAEVAAGA